MGIPFRFVGDADMRAAGGLDIPAAIADLRAGPGPVAGRKGGNAA